ncbi:MAG: metalloregulator ArsR/SmtB family transcription factor [Anaerolineae bacterium]|nr:metalloregulator ArsR/SmtB family transcription factor [Anaerolineae bacterium]
MAIAPPPADVDALAQQLKLLANPKRLQLIHLLMEGVQCNCELGDALDMAPNLISHHLGLLRDAGLVDVERDAVDARWLYYSINEEALAQLNATYGIFFNPERIKPRRPTCGPGSSVVSIANIALEEA